MVVNRSADPHPGIDRNEGKRTNNDSGAQLGALRYYSGGMNQRSKFRSPSNQLLKNLPTQFRLSNGTDEHLIFARFVIRNPIEHRHAHIPVP